MRGKTERQHHAANPLRTQCIDGDRRAQSGVDATRHTEQHGGKAVFADIVAQSEHARRVVALVAVEHRRDRPVTTPATISFAPAQRGDAFFERRQLRRHREIGVQRKRRAVEHQFVLPADLIEINQRQPAFGDPRNHDRQPQIAFFSRVRRAIRHHQNFSAGLCETFDDVFVIRRFLQPDVLADRYAHPDAAHGHRAGGGAAREQALFVEHAVVRKVCLETNGCDAPAVQQRAGVVKLAILDPGAADQHRRAAIGGLSRQGLDGGAAGRLKRRLQHQVLGRVAGNEQFRQQDEIGAVSMRLRACRARLGGVALDVAYRRVQLCQCNRKLL